MWFLHEYVLNLLQGELHTLHEKGLCKKTCVSQNCIEYQSYQYILKSCVFLAMNPAALRKSFLIFLSKLLLDA